MFTQLLNKTAEVQQKTLAQNGIGETAETWSKKGSYACRVEKNSQPKVLEGAYKVTLDDFIFFFDPGVVIERDDRIIVDGRTYNVIGSYTIDGYASAHHIEAYGRYHDHG